MKKLSKIIGKTVGTIGSIIILALIALIVYFVFSFYREMLRQNRILPLAEKNIGFHINTPEVDGDVVMKFRPDENSIAEKAGLKYGDILVESNETYNTLGEFSKAIYDSRGETFTFSVIREGEIIEITIPEVPIFEVK